MSLELIANKNFPGFNIFSILHKVRRIKLLKREIFELEYPVNCSPRVLFARLCTPEGLGEWFADEVTAEGDVFTFYWNKVESKAKLVALKENKFVRFAWLDLFDEDSNFFEFRINIEEISGSVALIITDFAEADEKEDSIYLWDTQVTDLKRVLGI